MPRLIRSILLALLVLTGGSTGLLALTAEDLKPLAEDDFDAKSQALNQIIAAADATALRVLDAMAQDNVVATSDGRVLIQNGDVFKDPITDAPVAVKASDVQAITLNNLLRARVESGLSARRLQDPDHKLREKAINDLFQAPDPAAKPQIEAARSKETDPVLKARLDQLWALTALQDPDPAKRLQAVQLIGERKDPQMRGLLDPLVTKQKDGTYTETDEKVRAAATVALKSMAFEQWKIEMIGTLFAGLSLGSILLLAALGLAITYGLIGVINMAHGEFLMIGAYATYVVQEFFRSHWAGAIDWYPLAAVPASFLPAAIAGFILERGVLRFLYGRPLETLLSTFGISLVLIQT